MATQRDGAARDANWAIGEKRQQGVNFVSATWRGHWVIFAIPWMDSVSASSAFRVFGVIIVTWVLESHLEYYWITNDEFDFSLQLGYGNITLDCPACLCNETGSTSEICNPHSAQCPCKEGVIGRQCDECEDTYFDLTDEGCEGKWRLNGFNILGKKRKRIFSYEEYEITRHSITRMANGKKVVWIIC